MTTYLTAGIVEMQQYIDRWPDLVASRCTSENIVEAFSIDVVGNELPSLQPIAELPIIDGVLNAKVVGATPVEDVARELEFLLRSHLPASEFEIRWTTNEYDGADAAFAALDRLRNSPSQLHSVRRSQDLALAPRCQHCSIDVATHLEEHRNHLHQRMCGDCARRSEHSDRLIRLRNLSAEQQRLLTHTPMPTSYEELSRLTPVDERRKTSRLATIFIDGNALGRVVTEMSVSQRRKLSFDLKQQTELSVVEAITDIYNRASEPDHLPVISHLTGGSDVLVTVPAALAWPFTTTFLSSFNKSVPSDYITAAAGIVFHPIPVRFADVHAVAGCVLRRAKRHGTAHPAETGTASASIGWVETNHSGQNTTDMWTIGLQPLMELTSSSEDEDSIERARHRLFKHLSELAHSAQPELDALARAAQEMASDPTSTQVASLGEDRGYHEIATVIQSADLPLAQLRELVDLARWWA